MNRNFCYVKSLLQCYLLSNGLILLVLLSFSTLSKAKTLQQYHDQHIGQCGSQYANQQTPQSLHNKNLDLYYLCFNGFAVGYSGTSKTALWSAEHLTKSRIEQANNLMRVDNFHEESQLPNSVKALLKDYHNVPYDRGHLSPNGDMNTLESQYDSFSLANIIPQNPKNNRGTWRSIESRTRYMALKYQDIYVVTGVAFLNQTIKKINNHILVPSHVYKAIYVPRIQQAGVYFVPNDDSERVEIISLNELALRTGIDAMPGVANGVQNVAMQLPTDENVTNHASKTTQKRNSTDNTLLVLLNMLLTIVHWLASLFKS